MLLLAAALGCGPSGGSPPPASGGGSSSGGGGSGGGGGGIIVPVGITALEATQRVASVTTVQLGMGTLVVAINGLGGDYNYYFNGSWQPMGCGNFTIGPGVFTITWVIVDQNGNATQTVLTVSGTAQ